MTTIRIDSATYEQIEAHLLKAHELLDDLIRQSQSAQPDLKEKLENVQFLLNPAIDHLLIARPFELPLAHTQRIPVPATTTLRS